MAMKVIKGIILLYILYAAFIGTKSLFNYYSLLWYNNRAPAPMPVWLPNGFYYSPDWDVAGVNNHITDKDDQEVIASDVKKVMWHDDFVYGYRTGHAGEVYYFICKYGENCSNSQSYKDIEFNKLLKKYNLPEFTSWDSKSYDKLLWEQRENGIDTSHGG